MPGKKRGKQEKKEHNMYEGALHQMIHSIQKTQKKERRRKGN
jgi:hypothetical protein